MTGRPDRHVALRCSCGRVEMEPTGRPIASTVCYCQSCQQGSRQLEELPNGRPIRDPYGGTAYILYRKDRIKYLKGRELLQGHKLEAESPTSRVVSTCCNSPMFLDFEKGHWLSIYRRTAHGDLPPVEMRAHTKSLPPGSNLPKDVTSSSGYPTRFIFRLLSSRIAMLLRR
jgi:hypothetical protein